MPIYEFVCKNCGKEVSVALSITEYTDGPYSKRDSIERKCEVCGVQTARHFTTPSIKLPMPDHYNRSAGTYVTGERQLRDEFKRKSEAATIRTGVEHNFVPIDYSDRKALGVTDQGLDATYNRRKELGMPIPDVIRPEHAS